jgi:tryptophan-rich sensory protein
MELGFVTKINWVADISALLAKSLNPLSFTPLTGIALIVCLGAAALESFFAGSNVRQRFHELRLPRYSPPIWLWVVIGLLYYTICFVVLRELLSRPDWSVLNLSAFALLLVTMLYNAGWNIVFFRMRSLRGSFLAFFPYAIVLLALAGALVRVYPLGAVLVALYCGYLCYAAWWSYRLWRLNR